jgi:hypothetical protein
MVGNLNPQDHRTQREPTPRAPGATLWWSVENGTSRLMDFTFVLATRMSEGANVAFRDGQPASFR